MPIFGQVWLWSLLAFLLGALLCWLLVARPARTRVGELEAQLTSRPRRLTVPERPDHDRRRDDDRGLVPGFDRGDDAEHLTRSYGLQNTPPPLPPERDRLAKYADPESDEFAPLPAEPTTEFRAPAEADTELAQVPRPAEPPRPAAATQYLDVSAGFLSAPPEVPPESQALSDRGWFDDELDGDAANKGPEEQPAVPRNRHHLDDQAHFVDDDMEPDFASALDEQAPEEPRSAIEDEDGGTVFTQRTHPIPGELIRQIDEAGKAELARPESDNLVDDMADDAGDEVARRDRTVEAEAVAPQAAFTEPEPSDSHFTEAESTGSRFTEPEPSNGFARPESTGSRFTEPEPSGGLTAPSFPETGLSEPAAAVEPADQPVVQPETPAERTEIVAAITEVAPAVTEAASAANDAAPAAADRPAERSASDLPKRVPQTSRISQGGVSVRVDPTPSALPKRVPAKPRHQVPFGVQPSATPAPPAPAVEVADQPADPARSLFEPIVPAADEGVSTPPPPHRLRQGSGGGRGPFGPGSAMPLPGGASPSPEFTIKASVAALRYCTPESPQFGRTVAEVWFRTAADAERVGFRPVG